jgi:hypothetical protein
MRFRDAPYNAGRIKVNAVGCETARQLVTVAHSVGFCQRALKCHHKGLVCRADETSVATQQEAFSCVKGERRVRWTFAGGY